MAWYDALKTFKTFFAPPAEDKPIADPTRRQLQDALAYVDPSQLTKGWRMLPYNPGWLVTRKGLSVFDTMKRDEQVKAALKFKKDSVLAAGWEVVSPGDEEEDWEVTRFVRDTFAAVDGGWNAALYELMSAFDYGYCVLERIYATEEKGEWKDKLVLKSLLQCKPHYMGFVTDEHSRLLGLWQQALGRSQQYFPTGKFVIYSHAKEFENFYGTSDLESAYRPWWVKENAYKWLAVTLERFGMPPLFALYNADFYNPSQVEELKKVVKGIQNATLGILPRRNKEDLEFYSQQLGQQSSNIFLTALERFDQHIARALLIPSLVGMTTDAASEGGKQGSYARSKQHFDSFLQVIQQIQKDLEAGVINAQVIPQLCDLNFANLQAYPQFRFLKPQREGMEQLLASWAELVGGKVVNRIEDDETHIRKLLGFPENEKPVLEPLPEKGAMPEKGKEKKALEEKLEKGEEVPEEELTQEERVYAEDNPEGRWVTIKGRHVFIKEGEAFISKGKYEGPEGPYISPWASSQFFLIRTLRGGSPVFAIVQQGQQPDSGTPFPTLKDARLWLRENGFGIKKKFDEEELGNEGLGEAISEEDLTQEEAEYAAAQGGVWRTVHGRRVFIKDKAPLAERVQRALATHKPATREKQTLATEMEAHVAEMIGAEQLEDHEPVDVVGVVKSTGRRFGVEVKTFNDQTNDKVTMHPDSLARKLRWARREKAALHTVVIDARDRFAAARDAYSGTRYWYRKGVGSFRLHNMVPVRDEKHLQALVAGEAKFEEELESTRTYEEQQARMREEAREEAKKKAAEPTPFPPSEVRIERSETGGYIVKRVASSGSGMEE